MSVVRGIDNRQLTTDNYLERVARVASTSCRTRGSGSDFNPWIVVTTGTVLTFIFPRQWTQAARTVAAEGANIAAFGCLWVLQFAILDRLLFKTAPSAIPVTGQL